MVEETKEEEILHEDNPFGLYHLYWGYILIVFQNKVNVFQGSSSKDALDELKVK